MSQAMRRRFTCERVGDVVFLTFIDKSIVDEHVAQQVGAELEQDALEASAIIVNFTGLSHCSSATLGKLIRLEKTMRLSSRKLVLCGMNEDLRQVFAATRLDRFFTIVGGREDALAAVMPAASG